MTKYQSSIDGLQRILDEYPGTHHGFDYAFLSEEESKKIIREARDELIELRGMVETYNKYMPIQLLTSKSLNQPFGNKIREDFL